LRLEAQFFQLLLGDLEADLALVLPFDQGWLDDGFVELV